MIKQEYKIFISFNAETKKYDGYKLIRYRYEYNEKLNMIIGLGSPEVIYDHVSVEYILIMLDLLNDGELIDRDIWESRVKGDDDDKVKVVRKEIYIEEVEDEAESEKDAIAEVERMDCEDGEFEWEAIDDVEYEYDVKEVK